MTQWPCRASPRRRHAPCQTKTITGEAKVVTATVEAIEKTQPRIDREESRRQLRRALRAAGIKRFDTLKIGDKVTARYYENVVLTVEAPGDEERRHRLGGRDRGRRGSRPAPRRTSSTITATITAIDPKAPSITFTGPRGWTYSTRVEDKGAREGEGRRQGRHHLDRSARAVARSRGK